MDGETFVKSVILVVLCCLIVVVAMAVDLLRRGDQMRITNLCKNGIDVPLAKGALVNTSALVFPSQDTTFHIDLGCDTSGGS